jgi:predicted amidohydrolase YtcJ
MKRNLFLILLLVGPLFCAVGLSQSRPALVDEMGYADTLVINGKIVSMDDRSSDPNTTGNIYEALAIKGKKIMALGSTAEMKRLAGPRTQLVDVGERTVIPGIILTHYHLETPAARAYGPQVGLVDPSVKLTVVAETTAEATAKKLRDTIVNAIQVRKIPKGQWITVRLEEGKNNRRATAMTWLYLGKINRRHLDTGTEDNPVLVRTDTRGVLNGTAIAEILKEFPDWEESATIENGPGAGKNGTAAISEIQGLPYELWWKDEPLETVAEMLRLRGLDLQKMGITTVSTRIFQPRSIAAFNLLNREERMAHRLAYYTETHRGAFFGLKAIHQFYKASGAPWTDHAHGGEMLWMPGMSNEGWDSHYNEVCLGPDVPAPPEIKERERCPGPGGKAWEAVKAAIVNGWRPVGVHGVSSHGARLYLQMLDEAMEEGGYSLEYMRNLRTTLEHVILLGTIPDLMEGIKKYGIMLNVSTDFMPDVPENIRDYGEQLRELAMPVKTYINMGIRVTSDSNAGDIWTPIYSLVNREFPDFDAFRPEKKFSESTVLLPEEAIDRVTALKMFNTWASEYMLAEDTIGTLEPGKFADFAVLEKDFFTIPIEEVRDMKVVMTGLGGKIVYNRNQGASAR